MKCRYCGSIDSRVIDSRPSEDGLSIRRRRECNSCGRRFTTFGRIEAFEREKVAAGIRKACEKRPISADTQNRMVDEICREVYNTNESEISTRTVGELVMKQLRKVDEVAYVRFASVYREFKDTQTFMEELQRLLNEQQ